MGLRSDKRSVARGFAAWLRPFVVGPVTLMLVGCLAKRSDYSVPDVPLPAKYRSTAGELGEPQTGSATGAAEASETVPPPPAPPPQAEAGLAEWWHSFGSEELEALIDRGMANNADIRMATLRVVQAKARAEQAGAGRFPTITMPMISATQYPGSSNAVGTAPSGSSSSGSGSGSGSGTSNGQNTFQTYLRYDLRLDIWGEQAALAESAGLQLWRAIYERDNIRRNMAATLASHYVDYVTLNDRLRVAKETEAVLNATLSAIEKKVAAGDATLAELEQQRAAIFSLRATVPQMEQARDDALSAIAFLVGTVPGALKLSGAGLDSLTLPSVVPGLPSALLLRRPDVRMAEARLLAADADLDVARARILPPVDLSAQVGYSSTMLSQLFLPQALFWNTVANLSITIFDGGRRSNEKVYAQALKEEMVESYLRTVYQSLREVESALVSVRLAEKRQAAEKETIAAARRAWDISSKVYALGNIDYLSLLETERNYHRYLDEYQRIRSDYFRGYVTLFQALGGGVKPGDALPGLGARPRAEAGAAPAVSGGDRPRRQVAGEGVGWGDGGSLQVENFWQVELAGLYDRSAIGPAWRDLRTRYPEWMEGRALRPRLYDRVGDGGDNQESWYRLYVAKFDSPGLAAGFCATLNASQQRCRVVSSRSDDTVTVPAEAIKGLGQTSLAATSPAPTPASEAAADAMTEPALTAATPVTTTTPEAAADAPVKASADTAPQTPPLGKGLASIPRDLPKGRKPVRVQEPVVSPATTEVREGLAYAVQLGAFANRENAALAQLFWKQKGYDAYVSDYRDASAKPWFVVRVGAYPQKREAAAQAQSIRNAQAVEAMAVPILVDYQGKPSSMLEVADPATADTSAMAPAVPEPPEAGAEQLASTRIEPIATAVARDRKGRKRKVAAPKLATGASLFSGYALQVGAFSSQDNARIALEFWKTKGRDAYLADILDGEGRHWYALRIGRYSQRRAALTDAEEFGRHEGAPAMVVPVRAPASAENASSVLATPAAPATETPVPTPSMPAAKAAAQPSVASAPTRTETPVEPALQAVAPRVSATPSAATESVPQRHGAYTVQLGAFSQASNAAKALAEWEQRGYPVYVSRLTDAKGATRYALRVGNYERPSEGLALIRKLDREAQRSARLTEIGIEDADRLSREELSAMD